MGRPDYEEFLLLAQQHERVHLGTRNGLHPLVGADCAFPSVLTEILVTLSDQIVLGSDLSHIRYAYVEQISGLVRLDLGDQWLGRIRHDNAADLLALS